MRMVKFFYKYLYWLVPWWYAFTMQVTRRRRYAEVVRLPSMFDIAGELGFGRRWRPDPAGGLIDVMSHPRKVQWKIDKGKVGIGDCDDHAIYWATSLLKNYFAQRAYICTYWAKRPSDKRGFGHVVCVWEDRRGDIYWADYREPARTIGEWGFARDSAETFGAVAHAAGLIEVKLRKSGEPKLCKKVKRIVL